MISFLISFDVYSLWQQRCNSTYRKFKGTIGAQPRFETHMLSYRDHAVVDLLTREEILQFTRSGLSTLC
jgi:hypothetical protein